MSKTLYDIHDYLENPQNRYSDLVNQMSKKNFIDYLINNMSISDKVAQMYQIVEKDNDFGSNIIDKDMKQAIREGEVGIILGQTGWENVFQLQKIAVEESPLGIPLLFNADVIHGYDTIFPIPLAMSCSFNMSLIEQVSHITAIESTAAGVHWNNAPMLDISRDPRWGRCTEGAGEDPYLCGEVAKAQIKGMKGNGLGDRHYMMSCAKHFVGYGQPDGGRDYNTVDMSDRLLRDVYLKPFIKAIEAGVDSIMPAFNTFNGIPCTSNTKLLKTIGREEFGFDGIYLSDYGAVEEQLFHGSAENYLAAAEYAINATVDVEMVSPCYHESVEALLDSRRIKMEQIDDSVKRILNAKYDLGLFHNPYRYIDPKLQDKVCLSNEHVKKAREIARESIVLLENQLLESGERVLPLKKHKKIALIGPFAESKAVEGSWAFVRNRESMRSLKEGMITKLGKEQLMISKGCEIITEDDMELKKAIETASKSDVIVLAVGESTDMSGEAKSYANLRLPKCQNILIDEMVKLNKPIVMVLFSGRPLIINDYKNKMSAILEVWFLGTESGNAIADVLVGDYNPSGRLTMSFPESVGQIPVYYNYLQTGRPYENNPDDPYRSKYMDISNKPLYPFGYGLSYSEFKYTDFELDKNEIDGDGRITATVLIENNGVFDGEEVVQLYVWDKFTKQVSRPVKELVGFKKVKIKSKEKKQVSFSIDETMLRFYSKNNIYESETGDFRIYVGGSSETNLYKDFKLINREERIDV